MILKHGLWSTCYHSTNHQNQWLSRTKPHDTITTYKAAKHNYAVNNDTPDASLY